MMKLQRSVKQSHLPLGISEIWLLQYLATFVYTNPEMIFGEVPGEFFFMNLECYQVMFDIILFHSQNQQFHLRKDHLKLEAVALWKDVVKISPKYSS